MTQKIINFFCFVGMIIGVMAYSTHEDDIKAETQLTNKQAITMTQEIVKEYGPLILKDLGVKDDGILSRITVSKGVVDDDYSGFYTGRTYTQLDNGTLTYAEGTNHMELYPYIYLIERDEDGEPIFLQKDQYPSEDEFKQDMLKTFAHELRHYWQDRTGELFNHPYDESTPHDERWIEIDANNYKEKYYESISE